MLTVDFDRLGLKPGERILDMGAGAGRHAFEAYRRGGDVLAFDQDADELSKVRERLAERGLKLELTDDAKELIINKSNKGGDEDNPYGARPLRREVERLIEDPLSEELLKGEFQGKDTITVSAIRDDENKFRRLDFKGSVSEKKEPEAAETK